jgi:hypothetical protein
MVEDETAVPGRPSTHTEPWAKIAIVLLDRHVNYLDRLAIDIRLRHGRAISRAEVMRGLIELGLSNPDRESLEKFLAQFAGTVAESESA